MFVLRHHGWAAVPANWFIAFPVSTEGLLERLEPPPPRVRLFAAEDLHVTLAFLGPVGEDAARRAFEHTAALGLAPFRATLGEVVALGPPRRRSALAATIADGREGLVRAIATHARSMALAAGATPERRAPLPHVTVARVARRATERERAAALRWAEAQAVHEHPVEVNTCALYTRAEDAQLKGRADEDTRLFRIVTCVTLTGAT
ncbi:MAG: 2'-5' RNA ligase family protein [Myxococcales bacterium]|nr:2'-5' RNA ligase family protein [Myxococcales bacterium]